MNIPFLLNREEDKPLLMAVHMHPSNRKKLIPVSHMHTLKKNTLALLGLETNGTWESDILWHYSTDRMMVAPHVDMLLSTRLSELLATRGEGRTKGHIPGVLSVKSTDRSMNWQVTLHVDAFENITDLPFTDRCGHLTLVADSTLHDILEKNRPLELTTTVSPSRSVCIETEMTDRGPLLVAIPLTVDPGVEGIHWINHGRDFVQYRTKLYDRGEEVRARLARSAPAA